VSLILDCPNPETTLAVGERIGTRAPPGLVVALVGPLGAVKTWLTKGIAKGLGVADWRYLTSPTFALHNIYHGRLTLHHLDLYRIGEEAELDGLGLEDLLYGSDVCVIEWPDFFLNSLPKDLVSLRFQLGEENGRRLEVSSGGPLSGMVEADLVSWARPAPEE
jgi:tRNA threonylcarbamoyladenosine biosynthesis protein TsaE